MTYDTRLIEEESPGGGRHWYADYLDLPGCHAVGHTQKEAVEALNEARASWLRIAREHDGEIPPEPEVAKTTVSYLVDTDAYPAISAGTKESKKKTFLIEA